MMGRAIPMKSPEYGREGRSAGAGKGPDNDAHVFDTDAIFVATGFGMAGASSR